MINAKLAAVVAIGVLFAAPSTNAEQLSKAPDIKLSEQGDVQGVSSERLAHRPVMKAHVDNGVFPGAVTMVARGGQLIHFEAHGFLDEAKSKPMRKDALFRLASMTKPIVSVAAVMMIERGDMKLHDPASLWLPELKNVVVETRRVDKDGKETIEDIAPTRPILVHDLLRHTTGFVYGAAASRRASRKCISKATSKRAIMKSQAMRC